MEEKPRWNQLVVVVVVVVRFFNEALTDAKSTDIHVTEYGRLIQNIMHKPSQAKNIKKQEINTLINVTVQHTVQTIFRR